LTAAFFFPVAIFHFASSQQNNKNNMKLNLNGPKQAQCIIYMFAVGIKTCRKPHTSADLS